MNYVLHPEAALEHEKQVAYYEERQANLGNRYHSAFKVALPQLVRHHSDSR